MNAMNSSSVKSVISFFIVVLSVPVDVDVVLRRDDVQVIDIVNFTALGYFVCVVEFEGTTFSCTVSVTCLWCLAFSHSVNAIVCELLH